MKKQNINYTHAHIFLNPECLNEYLNINIDYLNKPQFNESESILEMKIKNSYLQMKGITIPTSGMYELNSKEKIIESGKRIIGNIEPSLERYLELANLNIVQNNLYFNKTGLVDYSRPDKLEGKKVTEWFNHAKNYPSDIKDYFPEDIKLPENAKIQFAPTFQKLRDLNVSIQKTGELYGINEKTLAESIDNFLLMYDSVIEHFKWIREKEIKRFVEQRKTGKQIPHEIHIAELVLE